MSTHNLRKSLPLFLISLVVFTSGCAQIVTKTHSPTRGGVVKYNTGFFMADKNREKALEEMKAYCSPGRAQMLREDSKLESTGQGYTSGNNRGDSFSSTATESKEANMYIQFRCVKSSRTARR